MTDFYRKVNKFSQKFAKCDPCLTVYSSCRKCFELKYKNITLPILHVVHPPILFPPPPKKKSISSVFSLIDRRWKLPFVEPAPQTPTIRILTSLAYYKTTTWSSTRHNSEKCKYKNYKTVFLNWYINNRWSLTPFYTPLSSCEAMNKMIHKVPVIRNYQSKT